MSKVFTAEEVKKHNTRRSVWMVIRNDVYDVTAFVEEHPGGEDPLLEAAGQDATIAFDDVGHSASARGMLRKYKIGSLAPGQGCASLQSDEKPWLRYSPSVSSKLKWMLLALGLAIIGGIAYKKYSS